MVARVATVDQTLEEVLSAPTEVVVERVRTVSDLSVEWHALGHTMERAVGGSRPAVRRYVAGYRQTARHLIEAAQLIFPESVVRTEDRLAVVDADGRASVAPVVALEEGAVQAPFSAWVGAYGAGLGVMLDLVSRVRAALRDARPLVLPNGTAPPHWDVDDGALLHFIRAVRSELQHGRSPLDAIADSFGLSETELAGLFGVRRQAVSQWRAEGVPSARQQKVATVASIADLLARKLKAERLPGIARRPADAYGGQTMLQMVSQDRHDELLASVRESFSHATTA
jgi:hypothetical protein